MFFFVVNFLLFPSLVFAYNLVPQVNDIQLQQWNKKDNNLIITSNLTGTYQLHEIDHVGGARKQISAINGNLFFAENIPFTNIKAINYHDFTSNNFMVGYLKNGKEHPLSLSGFNDSILVFKNKSAFIYRNINLKTGFINLIYVDFTQHHIKKKRQITFKDGANWKPIFISEDGSKIYLRKILNPRHSLIYCYDLHKNKLDLLEGDEAKESNYYPLFADKNTGYYFLTSISSHIIQLAYRENKDKEYLFLPVEELNQSIKLADYDSVNRLIAFVTTKDEIDRLYIMNPDSYHFYYQELPEIKINQIHYNLSSSDLAIELESKVNEKSIYVLNKQLKKWVSSERIPPKEQIVSNDEKVLLSKGKLIKYTPSNETASFLKPIIFFFTSARLPFKRVNQNDLAEVALNSNRIIVEIDVDDFYQDNCLYHNESVSFHYDCYDYSDLAEWFYSLEDIDEHNIALYIPAQLLNESRPLFDHFYDVEFSLTLDDSFPLFLHPQLNQIDFDSFQAVKDISIFSLNAMKDFKLSKKIKSLYVYSQNELNIKYKLCDLIINNLIYRN